MQVSAPNNQKRAQPQDAHTGLAHERAGAWAGPCFYYKSVTIVTRFLVQVSAPGNQQGAQSAHVSITQERAGARFIRAITMQAPQL